VERSSADPSARAPGRRERNKRDKRERIVRAAGELFREQGFDATTGRQICERAGIATGTLFLYVRDKRELLFLIFRPLAEGAFRRLPAGLREGEGVVDGWMRLFGAFFRLYGREPRLARLFVQELLFRDDQRESMRALSGELASRAMRVAADGAARGELRGDLAPETIGQAALAHYVFWIQLWLGTGAVGRRAAERGLRRALEAQLAGIAAPRASSRRRSR
jgi:AcrR family transcriptional regulator